jgi:hypothetical protein
MYRGGEYGQHRHEGGRGDNRDIGPTITCHLDPPPGTYWNISASGFEYTSLKSGD